MKKLMKVVLAAMMAVAMVGCSNKADGDGNDQPTFKIGLHYELTGAVADYGNAEFEGSKLAIKQANEKAGYEKYTYVSYDEKSDVSEAVTIAQNLVNDGVVGVVGPATSGASAASYPILNASSIPVVSPSATAVNQTINPDDNNVYDYVYRICFEDSFQGASMAQYAYDVLGAKTAVIYGDNSSDYGIGCAKAFKDQFEKLGGTIVATENYVKGDTDFSSVITKLMGKAFDTLYIPGYYEEAGLMIKQARQAGMTCPILGPDGFDAATFVDLATPEALNNVYYTTAYTTVDASEELQAFIAAYEKEYSKDAGMFAALAYDATNLLIEACEKAGVNDTKEVKAYLDSVNFKGVTGDFSFDETHTPIKSVIVVSLVDGVQTGAESVTPK